MNKSYKMGTECSRLKPL